MDDHFPSQLALELCASRSISEVLTVTFRLLEGRLPTDELLLGLYDAPAQSLNTVAFVSAERTELLFDMPAVVPVSSQAAARLLDETRPAVTRLDEMGRGNVRDEAAEPASGPGSSLLVLRLRLPSHRIGTVVLRALGGRRYTAEHERQLEALELPLACAVGTALDHHHSLEAMDRLRCENDELKRRLTRSSADTELIGANGNGGLARVAAKLRDLAPSLRSVLLLGEPGVGKETLAAALHTLSPRRDGPFIKVECASLTEHTGRSELFGHAKGAFMGARSSRLGAFELASGGTLFLEQVDRLPPVLLGELVQAITQREFQRADLPRPVRLDVRLVASSHGSLEELVEEGVLLPSILENLRLAPIRVPPLRERRDDLPMLARKLAAESAGALDRRTPPLGSLAIERLARHDWRGNLRELRIVIAHEIQLRAPAELTLDALEVALPRASGHVEVREATPQSLTSAPPGQDASDERGSGGISPLEFVMARHLERALAHTRGRIEGPDGAAALVGLNPSTLRHRLRKLGIPFGRGC